MYSVARVISPLQSSEWMKVVLEITTWPNHFKGTFGINHHQLEWKKFIKQPEAATKSIIQEFYTNVPDAIDNIIKVRNILVLFGPNHINDHY